MQKSTMESASWQRPLYGSEITPNQAKTPLKSGFSDGLGGAIFDIALRISELWVNELLAISKIYLFLDCKDNKKN